MAYGKRKEYDVIGKVALWKQEGGKGNSPVLHGNAELEGFGEVRIALWRNDNTKEGAPQLTGKVSVEKGAKAPAAPAAAAADEDFF